MPDPVVIRSNETAAAAEAAMSAKQTEAAQAGLQSPALANLVNNYTQPGSPYGPQYSEGGIPNQLPAVGGGEAPTDELDLES